MPHAVGHDLVCRTLTDKTELRRFVTRRKRRQLCIFKINTSRTRAVRRDRRLELPQERGFSASAFAAKRDEFAAIDRKGDLFKRGAGLVRISKGQIFGA